MGGIVARRIPIGTVLINDHDLSILPFAIPVNDNLLLGPGSSLRGIGHDAI